MMTSIATPIVLLSLCFLTSASGVCHAESCDSESGILMCAQFKGSCGLDDIISGQAREPEMDMIFVSIRNASNHAVNIDPNLFYGISENGAKVTLDKSLYESIEWKKKLSNAHLCANCSIEGFLFFPSTEGHIKVLEYTGNPHMKVELY